MRRPDRILCLAWSLPDVQPAPAALRTLEQRAPSPSHWAACPAGCVASIIAGHGFVQVDKFGRESVCSTCHGAGRCRVDSYTGSDISSAEALTLSRTRRVDCDGCGGTGERFFVRCPHCDGAGKVSVPLVPHPASVGSRLLLAEGEVKMLRNTGSYDALEDALEQLLRVYPAAWSVWYAVRVYGATEIQDAGGWLRAGDRLINEFMPPHVRVPTDIRTAWERIQDGKTRDERIRKRYKDGQGSVAIAVAENISVRRVQQIVSVKGNGRAAA